MEKTLANVIEMSIDALLVFKPRIGEETRMVHRFQCIKTCN
jgi:hypothetical protein